MAARFRDPCDLWKESLMHAKVSIPRGVAAALLLVAVLVAPVVDTAGTASAVGASPAGGSSNGPGGGRLVFTRFDPAIADDTALPARRY
jgi:hypothetical protein